LLAGEELMKTILLLISLFFSAQALATDYFTEDLEREFKKSDEVISIADLESINCSFFNGSEWSDLKVKSMVSYDITGAVKGRGPRYADVPGTKSERWKLLVDNVERSWGYLMGNKELSVEWFWYSQNTAQLVFRKSGAYVNFIYTFETDTSNLIKYYGYCWREKN
jgi:hypothetical protein